MGDEEMWIMLTKKLHTAPSPPKMSIFWSLAWPDGGWSEKQKNRIRVNMEREDADTFYDGDGSREPNWIKARRILYDGHIIRVFPHEYTEQTPATMTAFIHSDEPSHVLVSSSVAGEQLMRDIRSGVRKSIYDAALLDGCNRAQALATAWGHDITIPDSSFPPLGWYRCIPGYAQIFCHDWEIEETPVSTGDSSTEIVMTNEIDWANYL